MSAANRKRGARAEDGTSYCPLAEANAAAVARDAKVAEIVARQDKLVLDQAIGFIEIRSLYPDADDGWGVWAEDDIPATMLRDGGPWVDRKHVTAGERCWCDPKVETIPAKKPATEAADPSIQGDDQ